MPAATHGHVCALLADALSPADERGSDEDDDDRVMPSFSPVSACGLISELDPLAEAAAAPCGECSAAPKSAQSAVTSSASACARDSARASDTPDAAAAMRESSSASTSPWRRISSDADAATAGACGWHSARIAAERTEAVPDAADMDMWQ